MRLWRLVLLLALTTASRAHPSAGRQEAFFELHIVHINDLHARFDQVDGSGDVCDPDDQCFGGFARVAAKANELISAAPDGNYLLLNAGDNFQGTLWYSLFTWNVTAHFLNMIPFDAATLGNHEFDDGLEVLIPFLDHVAFPVVAANIDASLEPSMLDKFTRSVVIERGGRRIGVVGYLLRSIGEMAATGKLNFLDEAESLAEEAARLKADGVDIVIALSHAGIDVDRRVAAKVPDVDIIVGGHSHTLLYTGTPPDRDTAEGVYPLMVTQESGRRVAIVQAGAFTKYLGHLVVTFDEDGELLNATGNPVLLDQSVPQDEMVLEELVPWRKAVEAVGSRVVGHTSVYLNATNFVCRGYECNIGNFLTDAMVDENVLTGDPKRWTRASVALMNSGNIRTSIDEIRNNGDVTYSDIVTACPFKDTIDVVEMRGSTLLQVLEHSVNNSAVYTGQVNGLNVTVHYAASFLQQSGLQVVYDVRRPAGSRVVSVSVRCSECRVPQFQPLQEDRWYSVAITSYMGSGGSGFTMLRDDVVNRTGGRLDTDVFIDYMKKNDPIIHGLDGRSIVLYDDQHSTQTNAVSRT